jgi:muconolactone delta-isomerase
MAQHMIEISLPADPDEEFYALVPHQRAHIDKLLEQGVVMGYSLSIDRSKLWIALNARNKRHATEILSEFPMFSYFEITIYPLMFHNASVMALNIVSMN